MSWLPSNDPILGDTTCDALELHHRAARPRPRHGFEVRRALPHGKRRMIKPFIFFDHIGPVQFLAGKGVDVRPHPHIRLATVTYLFDGPIMHRDSEGDIQKSCPRDEPDDSRPRRRPFRAHARRAARGGQQMLGPAELDRLAEAASENRSLLPAFCGRRACRPSGITGLCARIIAGSAFGATSPVNMVTPLLHRGDREAGASVPLDPDHESAPSMSSTARSRSPESAIEGPRLLIFRPGDRITVKATAAAALDVPRRRCDGRPAPYLVEFRLLAADGSSRPNRSGKRTVSPVSPPDTSSSRCRSRLSPSACPLASFARWFSESFHERHARQRSAPAANRARQGARYL